MMPLPEHFTVTARDHANEGVVDIYHIEPALMGEFMTDPNLTVIWVSITNHYGTPIKSIGCPEQFKAAYPQLLQ